MSQISLTARKSVVQMFSKSDIEIALNFAGIEIENLEMLAWFEHEGESSSSSQWHICEECLWNGVWLACPIGVKTNGIDIFDEFGNKITKNS